MTPHDSSIWKAPAYDPEKKLRAAASHDHWRRAMVLICEAHGLPAGELTPMASGSDVVFGGEGFIIKMTAPAYTEEIHAERDLLAHLTGRLSAATADLVASGEVAGWPYVVQSRLEGVALARVWDGLSHDERLDLAGKLGEVTAELHRIDPPEDDRWDAFLAERYADAGERHLGAPSLPPWAKDIDAWLGSVELTRKASVLLHTEILDEHVLVVHSGGTWRVAGLIDFADGRVGHPHYDFSALVEFIFRGEEGLLRRYLEAYGLDLSKVDPKALERELLAWYLLHRFGGLHRLVSICCPSTPLGFDALAHCLFKV